MISKLIIFTAALAAVSAAVVPDYAQEAEFDLRSFIHRCSYSQADINKCFMKNGNIAISDPDLVKEVKDLGIVSLNGFDIGDVFYSLDDDLSFLLVNVKSYARGVKLEKANVKSDEKGVFTSVTITYSLSDYYWLGEYGAIGIVNNTKIKERGNFRVNFGPFYGNYTAQFKQKEIDGEVYLKVREHEGTKTNDKFEFIRSNVETKGEALTVDNFKALQQNVINKAIETRLEYITFVFNEILLEIPQRKLFFM